MQGSITTPGSLALAHVQAQSQQPGGPKAPPPGQPSTLVTTTTTTTTTTVKTPTITRPTPSNFKKDVPVSPAGVELRSHPRQVRWIVHTVDTVNGSTREPQSRAQPCTQHAAGDASCIWCERPIRFLVVAESAGSGCCHVC